MSFALNRAEAHPRRQVLIGLIILGVIAVVGLHLVKWNPSYQRALVVAGSHTLGASIVTGTEAGAPVPSLTAALDFGRVYFLAVWQAMVLGLLLAATVEAFLPRTWLAHVLGSSTFRRTALGGMLALPGMMCTCCASPVAVSMRRNGVSLGASLAFWLGNPTLNPAVLVFIALALSWKWALLRLALGIVLVFGVSWVAARLMPDERVSEQAASRLGASAAAPAGHWASRCLRSLTRLILQLVPEYLVVVLVLGATRAWLFPTAGPDLASAPLVIVGLALAGTLFVIPTGGEIPIMQTMMAYGLGPGPAGALLMTLAPISLPSLLMLGRTFPARVLALVTAAVIVLGIVGGLLATLLAF